MWAKLDDRFHSHRKVRRAGLEAVGLFARSLSYAAAEGSDGHIEDAWVQEAAGKRAVKLSQALVEAGLWERNGTGFLIHDWLRYNLSTTEAAALVEKKRLAGKAGGEAKAKR
jgi:hypothetical protein